MRLTMTAIVIASAAVAAPITSAFSQSASQSRPGASMQQPGREVPAGHRQPTPATTAGDNKRGLDRVQIEQERVNRIENQAIGRICSNCGTRQ